MGFHLMKIDLAPALYISRKDSSVPERHVLGLRARMDIKSPGDPYDPAQGKVKHYFFFFNL